MTPLDARLGLSQGRLAGSAGGWSLYLGANADGYEADLVDGDRVEALQTFDVTDLDVIRFEGTITVPRDMPDGWEWVVHLMLDGERVASRTGRPGQTIRFDDLAINVSKIDEDAQVGIRLEVNEP